MQTVLEIKNLTKAYKTRKAVNDCSFSIYEGEVFGFLGPNGAGKSTTIKMICKLIKKTSGEIKICGYDIDKEFENAIANVGAIVEYPALYPYMSGLSNLKYFASLNGKVDSKKLDEIITLVGLKNRIKDKVSKYSLGMKQRLGIATALVSSPKLLILDEPTNGLDANGIKEMRELLKNLAHNHGVAIMVSSHILSEMEQLCDRVAIINDGSIVEIKTLEEIKRSAKNNGSSYIKVSHPNFAGKLIIDNFKSSVKIMKNNVLFDADEDNLAKIIVLLTKNRISIFGAGKVDFSLEDMFMQATSFSGTEIK